MTVRIPAPSRPTTDTFIYTQVERLKELVFQRIPDKRPMCVCFDGGKDEDNRHLIGTVNCPGPLFLGAVMPQRSESAIELSKIFEMFLTHIGPEIVGSIHTGTTNVVRCLLIGDAKSAMGQARGLLLRDEFQHILYIPCATHMTSCSEVRYHEVKRTTDPKPAHSIGSYDTGEPYVL